MFADMRLLLCLFGLALTACNGGAKLTPSDAGTSAIAPAITIQPTNQSVTVGSTAGSQSSNPATLTVVPAATAPSITTQPTNQSITVGSTATFSAAATGTAPLSYQWLKVGLAIAGATAATYTTPAALLSDSGSSFAVVVSNAAGGQTSNPAMLTVVLPATAPAI